MPKLGPIVRRIVNWPEPVTRKKTEDAGESTPGAAADRENPWVAASVQLAPESTAPVADAGDTAPGTGPAAQPPTAWRPLEEPSGTVFLRRLGRTVLWGVVVLAAVTGVRSWIVPNHTTVVVAPAAKPAPSYPSAQAQDVASRWARAYLSWDQNNPTARATALSMDMPQGTDTTVGWDGHGEQSVLAAQPGAVTVLGQGQARVRVDVLVQASASSGTAAVPSHWVGLDVPVVDVAGQIVVTGEPGIVGMPEPVANAPAPTAVESDAAMTALTQSSVQQFFTLYASGDTSTVAAPGAVIPALPGGMTFTSLESWAVDQGTGSTRIGTAVVQWGISGAVLEQTYRVSITEVSSASAVRWQVSAVHGGTS